MNRDIARKLIAIVSSSKRGTTEFSPQDFITNLSYKRPIISPESVQKFLGKSVDEGLLVKKNDKYVPNFSTSGIIVPLDFSITDDDLFSESTEKPLVDRILEAASASGKLTKKEAISRARELLNHMKLINFEIALLSVLVDEGLDVSHFIKEVRN